MHQASSALSPFDIAAILIVASAVLGYVNHHFIKLPHVIGLTVMGALAALGLMVADAFIPGVVLDDQVAGLLEQMNFTDTLLQGMLSFLLFAGALHVDLAMIPLLLLPDCARRDLSVIAILTPRPLRSIWFRQPGRRF